MIIPLLGLAMYTVIVAKVYRLRPVSRHKYIPNIQVFTKVISLHLKSKLSRQWILRTASILIIVPIVLMGYAPNETE